MINYLDIKPNKIYSKSKFNLILNPEDKYNNSAIFLLAPDYQSALDMITHPLMVNRRYFKGYYFEYSMNYYLTEGYNINNNIGLVDAIDFYNILEADDTGDDTESTNPANLRNPTKPRTKSKEIDGYKVKPTKKSLNMYRDPKSLMRHLRYDMRRAKYNLNKLKDDRSNVGGKINNPKGLEKTKKLLTKGKVKEINRKKREKWIEDNLKNKDKETTDENLINLKELGYDIDDDIISEDVMIMNNTITILNEDNSAIIKRMIFKDRLISVSDANKIYKQVRKDSKGIIKYGYADINKFKGMNIIYDLSYYNDIFFRNNTYKGIRGYNIYSEFLGRQLNNQKIIDKGYEYNCLIIPVDKWVTDINGIDINKDINPVSLLIRALRRKDNKVLKMFNLPIIMMSGDKFVKFDIRDEKLNVNRLITLIKKLVSIIPTKQEDIEVVTEPTKDSITTDTVEKIADKVDIEIKKTPTTTSSTPKENIKTGISTKPVVKEEDKKDKSILKSEDTVTVTVMTQTGKKEIKKVNKQDYISKKTEELNKTVQSKVTDKDKTIEDVLDNIEQDKEAKQKIVSTMKELQDLKDTGVKVSAVRSKRMETLNKSFNNLNINNRTVKEILDSNKEDKPLEITSLNVDSPNESWKKLSLINFEKSYDMDSDILKVLKSFTENKTYPISIIDINIENTSTSQDYKQTYKVKIEDIDGKRSTLTFDLPILVEDRYMMLKGNKKTMKKQIAPIPVTKIDEHTSQISSNYMKVTVNLFGPDGKAFSYVNDIISTLGKLNNKTKIKASNGDSRSFYNVNHIRPIDFLDLSSFYKYINIDNKIIYVFDIDELQRLFPDKPLESNTSYMVGYKNEKGIKTPMYYDYNTDKPISLSILSDLMYDPEFAKTWNESPKRNPIYKYSRAKVLQVQIPIIILMSYYIGLEPAMQKSGIEYIINTDKSIGEGYQSIRFKDGYIHYKQTYESSILMNGLSQINTKDRNISEANARYMYNDWLNDNGYSSKIDGLLNFNDLMMDPITVDCCNRYDLPTDFVSMLAYASNLLSDNKYLVHTDMTGRRIRSCEIIPGYLYSALAKGYQEYASSKRRGRNVAFSIKQKAIIDMIMVDVTFSDAPLLNDLQIFEAYNAISYQGLSGMNNDRSYSLDKRTYDKSMLNILGMATGFAGNVGINRQLTIDSNIETQRGYAVVSNKPEIDITKTYTMTEAIAPYGVTRNDPMRSAMNFVQTSNHSMRVEKGSPSLITNGADQALPYLSDNTFSIKANKDGFVKAIDKDYMIIEYKDKEIDMIDMRNQILKNSNGGFYTAMRLTPSVKLNQKVKQGDILAYDSNMYSNDMGLGGLSYKLGTLTKVAILNTDEGFEDSGIISEELSKSMSSEIVELKKVTLSNNTNILNCVQIGDPIQEGDPLLVFQDAGDEEYVAQLLSNLNTEKDLQNVGAIPIKSKVTGFVKDIKVYRTAELDELQPSLRKLVNKYEKSNKDMAKIAKQYGYKADYKYKVDTLEPTGKVKNIENGVLIEFYLSYNDKMSKGDKLIYLDAVKGVTQKVIPKGEEPKSQYRPNEIVHSMVSKGSLDARMVTSIKLNGAINKLLIELDRQNKEDLGIPWKNIEELGK